MQIGIYGAGGFGREVAWLLSDIEDVDEHAGHLVAYIDDAPYPPQHGIPVLPFADFRKRYPDARLALAVGNSRTRKLIVGKCLDYRFATLIHPEVAHSEHVEIGEGSIICCGCILTVDIRLGRHVHINLDCTVGHDVVMDDFVTLAPGVHVSGNVHIQEGVYIGTGANIINGHPGKPLVIKAGTVIGAGACVTHSTEPNALYAGVPAVLKKLY